MLLNHVQQKEFLEKITGILDENQLSELAIHISAISQSKGQGNFLPETRSQTAEVLEKTSEQKEKEEILACLKDNWTEKPLKMDKNDAQAKRLYIIIKHMLYDTNISFSDKDLSDICGRKLLGYKSYKGYIQGIYRYLYYDEGRDCLGKKPFYEDSYKYLQGEYPNIKFKENYK